MIAVKTFLRAVVALASVTFAGALTSCVYDKEEPEISIQVGDPLPRFSVTLLDGERFSTDELAGSEIENLVILFFNTNCPDCQRELPQAQLLYDRILADETLSRTTRLICIAREEDAASIREYWAANGLTLPASPQPDRTVYNLFASTGIPRLYLAQPTPNSPAFTITASLDSPADLFPQLLK